MWFSTVLFPEIIRQEVTEINFAAYLSKHSFFDAFQTIKYRSKQKIIWMLASIFLQVEPEMIHLKVDKWAEISEGKWAEIGIHKLATKLVSFSNSCISEIAERFPKQA